MKDQDIFSPMNDWGTLMIWVVAFATAALAFLTTFFVTPAIGRIGTRFGLLDHPDPVGHKRHSESVPYLGGISIFLGIAVGFIVVPFVESIPPIARNRALTVFLVVVLLVFVGLLDDMRRTPIVLRFVVQIVGGIATWAADIRVEISPWDWVNVLITVLWLVGITNAFNLLDNMDGLTAGLAAVAGMSFAALAATAGLSILAASSAAVAGAAAGFLRHNREPARIYMGDAGSTALGYLLAVIGLHLRFDNLVTVTFLVPVVVLAVPIMDTCLVVFSRITSGRPVFVGARDHISHRLVSVGLTKTQAVRLLYVAAASFGWLGLILSRSEPATAWMLMVYVVILSLYAGSFLVKTEVSR